MKKVVLSLLLCLLFAGHSVAFAAPVSSVLEVDGTYLSPNILFSNNDDLFLFENQSTLYHWQVGMAEPEVLADDLLSASWYSSKEEAEKGTGRDFTYATDAFFIANDRLYGLNFLTGDVFELTFNNGSTSFQPFVTLDLSAYQPIREGNGIYIRHTECVDNTLYLSLESYTDMGTIYRLDAYDLSTGKMTALPIEHVTDIAIYRDGKLLVSIYDQENAYDFQTGESSYPAIFIYNPIDNSLEKKVDCDRTYLGGLQYNADTDTLYYQSQGGIMQMIAFSNPQLCANKPTSQWGEAGPSALLAGDIYACQDGYVFVRSTNPSDLSNTVLTVSELALEQAMLFSKDYPSVAVSSAPYEDASNALMQMANNKDNSTDILTISSPSMLATIIDKGYALDLSSSDVIKDHLSQMNPSIQKACMRDGKIYAIPTMVYAPALVVEDAVLTEMPFSQADIPTDLLSLLMFTQEYPDEIILSGDKERSFSRIIDHYLSYYAYLDQPLTFDTPLFREALATLESLDWSKDASEYWGMDNELLIDYGNPLSGNAKRFPLSLSQETPYIATMDAGFTFINPNTVQPEMAIKYLEYRFQLYDLESKIILYPDFNDIPISPWHQENVDSLTTSIETFKASLESCEPSEVAEINEKIASYEKELETINSNPYEIRPDVIEQYRSLVSDNIVLNDYYNLFYSDSGSDEIQTLRNRYLASQISTDEFIQKLEKIINMMEKEKQ